MVSINTPTERLETVTLAFQVIIVNLGCRSDVVITIMVAESTVTINTKANMSRLDLSLQLAVGRFFFKSFFTM